MIKKENLLSLFQQILYQKGHQFERNLFHLLRREINKKMARPKNQLIKIQMKWIQNIRIFKQNLFKLLNHR